jgi:hypothetical protein
MISPHILAFIRWKYKQLSLPSLISSDPVDMTLKVAVMQQFG